MIRDAFPAHSLMLVEGNSDRAFWHDHAQCSRVVPTGNKDVSICVLDVVESEGELDGVFAIIDPDCWLVEESDKLMRRNVLYDDTPDLEVMLLKSPALERFFRNEMTGKDPDAIGNFARALCKHALGLGVQCGAYRLLNYRRSEYNLKLSHLLDSLGEYIDCETLAFRRDVLGRLLVSGSKHVSGSALVREAEAILVEFECSEDLCRGKDVLCIVGHIFGRLFDAAFDDDDLRKKVYGRIVSEAREGCYVRLQAEMRKAYDGQFLLETALYRRIREWEAAHSPFRIIRDYPLERTTP